MEKIFVKVISGHLITYAMVRKTHNNWLIEKSCLSTALVVMMSMSDHIERKEYAINKAGVA